MNDGTARLRERAGGHADQLHDRLRPGLVHAPTRAPRSARPAAARSRSSRHAGHDRRQRVDDALGRRRLAHAHHERHGANSGPATKLWADAAVRTDIHNANHDVVTTVQSGHVVHDKVFVTKPAGTPAAVPAPTGNVTFHRYATIDCTGASVDETVALAADGTAETSTFTASANMSYKADYAGNANYPARSGACEPLRSLRRRRRQPGHPGDRDHEEPEGAVRRERRHGDLDDRGHEHRTVTLTNVRVTDPPAPDCNRTSAQIPALASMAPGASLSYTCSLANVTASFTNVATDTGTPPTGPDVSATDSAHVTVPPPQGDPAHLGHEAPKDQAFVAPAARTSPGRSRSRTTARSRSPTSSSSTRRRRSATARRRTSRRWPRWPVGASVTYKCTKFVDARRSSPRTSSSRPASRRQARASPTATPRGCTCPQADQPEITIAKCPARGRELHQELRGVPKDTQSS